MEIELKHEKKQERKGFGIAKYSVILPIFVLFFLGAFSFSYYFEGGMDIKNPNAVKEYKSIGISLPLDLNEEIKKDITDSLSKVKFGEKNRFEIKNSADYLLDWKEGKGMFNQYIVPVSHFYAVTDDFSEKQKVYIQSSLPDGIKQGLKSRFLNARETDNPEKVLDEAGKVAVWIDSNQLKGTFKLMKFDGNYFLDNVNGSIIYSLNLREDSKLVKRIISKYLTEEIYTKYEYKIENITTLNQTGVTAISRDVAFKIEAAKDYGYPAKRISSFLKSTDLTHASNEVSSVAGCVPAQSMRFCAKPEYLKSLVDSGVDIVSLTGNHNNDFGADNNLSTIKQYEKFGMKYFGGGKNIEEASKILYVENKGNKIAFIGYNYYDTMLGTGALAGKDRAGANSYSESKMKKDIANARKNADIVIVDFQFQECYSYPSSDVIYPICYKPLASPDQSGTFRKAIDYGADIVVGVQAHQPQTYEIYKGKTIFYGLGNLFFDQIEWIGTRQGLILTHYFNKGKYIQTKISTTLYDNAMQTYISKGSDRTLLLNLLKDARD